MKTRLLLIAVALFLPACETLTGANFSLSPDGTVGVGATFDPARKVKPAK